MASIFDIGGGGSAKGSSSIFGTSTGSGSDSLDEYLSSLRSARSERSSASQQRALEKAFKKQRQEDEDEEGGWVGNAVGQVKQAATGLDDVVIGVSKGAWEDLGTGLGDMRDVVTGKKSFMEHARENADRPTESDYFSKAGRKKVREHGGALDRNIGEPIAAGMAHLYGPLAHGNREEFMRRWKQEPLSPILDVLSVFTLGAGAAGKAAGTAGKLGKGGEVSHKLMRASGREQINLSRADAVGRAQAEVRRGGKVVFDRADNAYAPRVREIRTDKGRLVRDLEKSAAAGSTEAATRLEQFIDKGADGMTREMGGLSTNATKRAGQQAYDYLSERIPYAPIVGANKRMRSAAARESRAAKARLTSPESVSKGSASTTAAFGAVSRVRADGARRTAMNLEMQGVKPEERIAQLERDMQALEKETRSPDQIREQHAEMERIAVAARRQVKREGLDGDAAAARKRELVQMGAREVVLARQRAAVDKFDDRILRADAKTNRASGKWVDEAAIPENLRDERFVREVGGRRVIDAERVMDAARVRVRRAAREEAVLQRRAAAKPDHAAVKGRAAATAARSAWLTAMRREVQEAKALAREAKGDPVAAERVADAVSEFERVRAMSPDAALREWAAGAAKGMDADGVAKVGGLLSDANLRRAGGVTHALAKIAGRRRQTMENAARAIEEMIGGLDRHALMHDRSAGTSAVSVADRKAQLASRADDLRARRADAEAGVEERVRDLRRVADDPDAIDGVLEDLDVWRKAVALKDVVVPKMQLQRDLAEAAKKLSPRERRWVTEAIDKLGPVLDANHRALLASGFQPDVARRMVLAQLTVGRKLADTTTEGVRVVPHNIEGSGAQAAMAGVSRMKRPNRTTSMHRNTGMSFRFALSSTDPRSIANILDANAEHVGQLRMYEEVADQLIGVPNHLEPPDGFGSLTKGKLEAFRKMYRDFREQAPAMFGADHHVTTNLIERMDGFFDQVDSKTGAGSYPAIPNKYAKMLEADMDKSVEAFGRAFDQATGIWRFFTLAIRPAWTAANVVGSAMLLVLAHGAADTMRLIMQTSNPKSLAGRQARAVFDKYGGAARTSGGASVLRDTMELAGGKGKRRAWHSVNHRGQDIPLGKVLAEATLLPGIARMNVWFNTITDDVFRRTAFIKEIDGPTRLIMDAEGIDFATAAEKLLADPKVLGRVEQRVLGDMIDFQDLNRTERLVVRRLSPFYGWLKGMTKREMQFTLEHPAITSAWLHATEAIADDPFDYKVPEFLEGAVPMPHRLQKWLGVGEGKDREGVFVQNAFNVLQTPADVVGQIQSLLDPSKESTFGPDNPFSSLNPVVRAPMEATFSRDMFSGETVPGDSWIDRLAHQGIRSTPVTKQLLDVQRAKSDPEWADRKLFKTGAKEELLKYLGIPVRDVNTDLAKKLGAKGPARTIVVDYPGRTVDDEGREQYVSYYQDPETGSVFAIRPFMPEDEGGGK